MEKIKPHLTEIVIFLVVIFLLLLGTYSRNKLWGDKIGLWTDCVKKSPHKGRPYVNLGFAYIESGPLKRLLKIYPYFPNAHHLLGIVCAAQHQFDKAVAEFEWEIRINPYHALAHLNLGQIYWYEFQNRQKALTHLKTALMLDPLLPNRAEIRRLVRLLEGLP